MCWERPTKWEAVAIDQMKDHVGLSWENCCIDCELSEIEVHRHLRLIRGGWWGRGKRHWSAKRGDSGGEACFRKDSDFSWGHVLFARAVITIYHRLGGLDSRIYFITILEARSSSQGVGLDSPWGLSPWFADGCSLTVSSHGVSFVSTSPVSLCVSRFPHLSRTPSRLD